MIRDEMSALHIRELVDAFEAAGLTDAVAPVAALLDRRDAIEKEFIALLAAGTDVRPLAARIAAGEIDLAGAAPELGAIVAVFAGPVPMLRHLRDHAKRRCLDGARTWLTENADALDETVEAAVADVERDIAKLAPALDGVASAEDAARAGGPAAKAWLKRKDLDERRSRLGEVLPALGRLGLLQDAVVN
jgi:hypothetical protein